MQRNLMTAAVSALAIGLFLTIAHGAESETAKVLTVQAVQKAIVGVWNGTAEPSKGKVLSFDAQGRITEDGFAGGGGLSLGHDENRQGKVKYRLEQHKVGKGIAVIEINPHEERLAYIIEAVDDKKMLMRQIHYVTKEPMAMVVWQRVSNEPIVVETTKPNTAADGKKLRP